MLSINRQILQCKKHSGQCVVFSAKSSEDWLNCNWSKCAWHIYSQNTLKSDNSHSPSLHWLLQEDVGRAGCIQDWFCQSDWPRRGWPGAKNIPRSVCKTQEVLHCCHLVDITVMSAKQNAEHILVCLSEDKVGRCRDWPSNAPKRTTVYMYIYFCQSSCLLWIRNECEWPVRVQCLTCAFFPNERVWVWDHSKASTHIFLVSLSNKIELCVSGDLILQFILIHLFIYFWPNKKIMQK